MLFGKKINKYYIKYLFAYTLGIVCLFAVDYAQLFIPEQIASIAELIKLGTLKEDKLTRIILTILLLGVIITIGRFLWRICLIGASRKIEKHLKDEMFSHSQHLSQEFHSRQKVGAMMSLFTADVDSVRNSLGFGIVIFVDAVFLTTMTLIKMFNTNVTLTLFSLIPMLTIGIGGIWFSASFTKCHKLRQEAQEDLSDFTQENFSGISVIKAFVKQRRELKEFLRYNKNVYNTSINFIKKIAFLETLIETLIASAIILIFAIGGYMVSIGKIYGPDLVAFYLLFILLIWPMIALAQIINNLSQGRASLRRITDFLEEEITVKDEEGIADINELKGNIKFNHLSFRYPNTNNNVLEDICLDIKAGEIVGIIGRTGCGKSTLVELLLRSYNIEESTLFFDDYDVMKIPIKSLRSNIGYVPQNNFLFSDTIYNNIAFGLEAKTSLHGEVEKMAQLADIDKNINEFKEGYKTIVGERGTTLSGGQKQRISIARALIRDPKILIFDDSVSAVDTATEVTILNNLKAIRRNKTTLVIGHRISTMMGMDKVILLDQGRIADIGTHQQLALRSTLYQDMIKAQELEE